MAYVPVPKDLNAVKTKVLFNLTKRQLICFGSGAAVAVPLFFSYIAKSINGRRTTIIMSDATLVFIVLLHRKNRGTATASRKDCPKHRAGLLPAPKTETVQDE